MSEASKYVWDYFKDVDTSILEEELAKDTPEVSSIRPSESGNIMRKDTHRLFPSKVQGRFANWNEGLDFNVPRYDVLYSPTDGPYVSAEATPIKGFMKAPEMIRGKDPQLEWFSEFYPDFMQDFAKKYVSGTVTKDDRRERKRLLEEYEEYKDKFAQIPFASTKHGTKAGTYYDLEQPDSEELVNILDSIAPTLDSLLAELSLKDENDDASHGHTHLEKKYGPMFGLPADSLYSKEIRNKLLDEGIHFQGIDPFRQRTLFGDTGAIGGFYERVEDTKDTLNLPLFPDTRETLDVFIHELFHSPAGVSHFSDQEHSMDYDREVDYAIQQLYKQNPKGYRYLENMMNEWTEGGTRGFDWYLPRDTTHTEAEFIKDEVDFLRGEQLGAAQEYWHNLDNIPYDKGTEEYEEESRRLKEIRDKRLIELELRGRKFGFKEEDKAEENKTMKLIRSWFE